jgi:WASH complex subunit 7
MCIKHLFKQSDDAGDYLRMIVRNFDGLLNQENTKHLKLFYLTIPALSISYIEHIQKGQEKINSKMKNVDGFISDDGFPLGLAYMLKILGQTDKFASLNWFDSVLQKLEHDARGADLKQKSMTEEVSSMNMVYEDQKLDAEMSRRRIKKMQREYEMLNFCFSASSILFKEI